ncbi:hypothetical protein [Microlunatus ginsengisoli]|uniref:Uncharacterized protein n=1 Tax=Microlunatus ginsengisoli TaxID=363863 RepID=A0ABP6ZVB0_9ACTN
MSADVDGVLRGVGVLGPGLPGVGLLVLGALGDGAFGDGDPAGVDDAAGADGPAGVLRCGVCDGEADVRCPVGTAAMGEVSPPGDGLKITVNKIKAAAASPRPTAR